MWGSAARLVGTRDGGTDSAREVVPVDPLHKARGTPLAKVLLRAAVSLISGLADLRVLDLSPLRLCEFVPLGGLRLTCGCLHASEAKISPNAGSP